jgi:hypothetical protein
MAVDPVKVTLAVSRGVNCVCATCPRYWEGRDKGLPGDQCTSKEPCGSPLAGLDFPHYNGQITNFELFCFVCGEAPKFGVRVRGGKRTIATCGECIKMLAELRPVGKEMPGQIPIREVSVHGEILLPDSFKEPPKKTLRNLIAQIESEEQDS